MSIINSWSPFLPEEWLKNPKNSTDMKEQKSSPHSEEGGSSNVLDFYFIYD